MLAWPFSSSSSTLCLTTARARVRGAIAVLVLATLVVLVGGQAATAASSTWGQSITTAGGTQSTGTARWNTSPLSVRLSVTTGTLAAGRCVTVFFDWASPTHYDARAIRDCRSNDTFTYTFTEPTPSSLSGTASKHGICYGTQDTHGVCSGSGSIVMDWTPWPDKTRSDPCVMSWALRNANGGQTSFIDTHPRTATLSAANTC